MYFLTWIFVCYESIIHIDISSTIDLDDMYPKIKLKNE